MRLMTYKYQHEILQVQRHANSIHQSKPIRVNFHEQIFRNKFSSCCTFSLIDKYFLLTCTCNIYPSSSLCTRK